MKPQNTINNPGAFRTGVRVCLFFMVVHMCSGRAFGQYNVMRVYGSSCVGQDNVFVFTGSCGSVTWSVQGGNYTIVSQNSGMIQLRWNAPTSSASVYAFYSGCPSFPFSGTAASPVYSITNTVTPSVSITANPSGAVCPNTNVTFTAAPVNGGSPPYYNWRVNGSVVSAGTSNTFASSTLNQGDVVEVLLSSSAPCLTTGTAMSNAITMNITQASPVTATLSGPSMICSGTSSNASFYVSVTNGGSSPTYTWLKNGFPVTDQMVGPPPYIYVPTSPLNNGDKIKCRITSNASCVSNNPAESNEYTVSLTPAITPTVGIQFSRLYYCSGETITFTASSSYMTGASTYSWQLNGVQFSTASAASLPVTTDGVVPNAFSPGDIVTVYITNLAGTCLSSTTATGTTQGVPFVITPLPAALVSPTGSLKICSTCTQNITATSGSGYSWQWKNNGVDVSPGGTVNPYPAGTAGTYTVVVTAGGCSKESSNALALTKNVAPVANAGPDKTLTLPTHSVTLSGSGSDLDGSITAYTWRKVSGGNATLTNASAASLIVSGLEAGTYVFGLRVTDDFGEQSTEDQVTVTVNYPDNNYNLIVTTEVLVPGQLDVSAVESLTVPGKQKSVVWNYFDDLGQPMQHVTMQGSPALKDIVQPVIRDVNGRELRKYLPVVVDETDGYYKKNADIIDGSTGNYTGIAEDFYEPGSNNGIADDIRPFAETGFEASPLNRPLKLYGPGDAWKTNDKFTARQYLTNVHATGASLTDEKIVAWKVSSGLPVRATALTGFVETGGYYSTGQLVISSIKDENGNEVREYRNKAGRIILKKVQAVATQNLASLNSSAQWALTYFIYDDLNNLRFVLQPNLAAAVLASDTYVPAQADLDKLAFQYQYDSRQRMVLKKTPGADPVYLVYDDLDRIVMTQEGNQRKDAAGAVTKREWTFTKYDALNRPVVTGIYTHASVVSQATMAGLISTTNFFETYNGNASTHGYTNTVFPTAGIQVLTVVYYDNYKFRDDLAGTAYHYTTADLIGQEASENTEVIGLSTGMKVNIVGTSNYLWNITYYDQKYRTIQTKSQNQKNGVDRITTLYDFARLLETKSVHDNGTASYSTHRKHEYDHAGRLTRLWHKFHTEPDFVLLLENAYNELGQVTTKKLHSRNNGSTFAQNTDYNYTIRGWLEGINDTDNVADGDLFAMKLKYNEASAFGEPAQHNGNISEVAWRSAGLDKQSYGYRYDAMNRLLEGNYYNYTRPLQNGRYTEKMGDGTATRPAYDLNGNILNLFRYGKTSATGYGLIDDLKYDYTAGDNKLNKMDEYIPDSNFDDGFKGSAVNNANEYTYDWNGNLTIDMNKGITSIAYNHMNLPAKISKSATEYIVYTYDATGRKLTQQVFGPAAKKTEYINEYVYENTAGTDVLQFVQHNEGRIVPDAAPGAPRPWQYQYFLKDYLGNVRVTFRESMTATGYKATFENNTAATESGTFRNYSRGGVLNEFDHTDVPGNTATYSQLLNAGNNSQVGVAKSLAVNPGDIIDLAVYAKYEEPSGNSTNVNALLASLTSAFALGSGATPMESAQAQSAFNSLFGGGPWITGGMWENAGAPKAYLNYILFDENFQLMDFGFDQISIDAKQVGLVPFVPHDYLSLHVQVEQKGYLYIYVSNESPVETKVYFDDLSITHHTGVVQVSDYYPFGLQIKSNGFEQPGGTKNSYAYNGKEMQDELNLGWLDYGARMYDPAIGRWNAVDGMAEKYLELSPYHYAGNNPVRNFDIDGNEFTDAAWEWIARMLKDLYKEMERLNKRIDKQDKKLSNANISDRKRERVERRKERIEGRRDRAQDNFNTTLNEVIKMEFSAQVYDVRIDPNVALEDRDRAATVYNTQNQRVEFVLSKSSADLGLFAHEFKHGYQFERGQASLQVYNGHFYVRLRGWLAYDLTDEIEAYEREKLFHSIPRDWRSGYVNRRIGDVQFPGVSNTMAPYTDCTHADLQQLANDNQAAFRINGTTYAPNR